MPKPYTFPTLLDNALQLNIRNLKRDGFIDPGRIRSGTVTWSCNGNKTASISIMVDMHTAPPYIELGYSYGDKPRKYRIRLVSVSSNLGAGEVWYFLCPTTSMRCRILYSVGGWFLHREAFSGVYYDSQIRSKKTRYFDRLYGLFTIMTNTARNYINPILSLIIMANLQNDTSESIKCYTKRVRSLGARLADCCFK